MKLFLNHRKAGLRIQFPSLEPLLGLRSPWCSWSVCHQLGDQEDEGQGTLSWIQDHGDPLIRQSQPCDDWPSPACTWALLTGQAHPSQRCCHVLSQDLITRTVGQRPHARSAISVELNENKAWIITFNFLLGTLKTDKLKKISCKIYNYFP